MQCFYSPEIFTVLKKSIFANRCADLRNSMGSYQRKYRVIGLKENGASTQTFPFERDGKKTDMAVQNYFEKELKVPLRYNYGHFYFEKFYLF